MRGIQCLVIILLIYATKCAKKKPNKLYGGDTLTTNSGHQYKIICHYETNDNNDLYFAIRMDTKVKLTK